MQRGIAVGDVTASDEASAKEVATRLLNYVTVLGPKGKQYNERLFGQCKHVEEERA